MPKPLSRGLLNVGNRTTGLAAIALGLIGGIAMAARDEPVGLIPVLACLVFIGLGVFHLLTDKETSSAEQVEDEEETKG